MPPLENTREEIFCLELASGCSLTEAAKKAGYSSGNAAHQGSLLIDRESVKARVKELQEAMVSSRVAAVLERKERLTDIIRATENMKPNDPIAAIIELNKMEGAYAPTKIEARSEEVSIKHIIIRRAEDLNDDPSVS